MTLEQRAQWQCVVRDARSLVETGDYVQQVAGETIIAAAAELDRLREALEHIEARAQSMLQGGYRGPWNAEYLREIAAEILSVAVETRT